MCSSHIVAGRWSYNIELFFFGVIINHNYDYKSLEVAQISYIAVSMGIHCYVSSSQQRISPDLLHILHMYNYTLLLSAKPSLCDTL